jgi:hypothetical protein
MGWLGDGAQRGEPKIGVAGKRLLLGQPSLCRGCSRVHIHKTNLN